MKFESNSKLKAHTDDGCANTWVKSLMNTHIALSMNRYINSSMELIHEVSSFMYKHQFFPRNTWLNSILGDNWQFGINKSIQVYSQSMTALIDHGPWMGMGMSNVFIFDNCIKLPSWLTGINGCMNVPVHKGTPTIALIRVNTGLPG